MNTRSGKAATPNTTARTRDDRQPLNKQIRTAKTWFPQHLRYFHVSFTRIDHEEKKVVEGRLANADHVRIFNHLFPEMVSTDYSHRHLREQWDGRFKKARSKDWFDIVRPNKKRKDGYTHDDLAEFACVEEEIQGAADALGIHVPWRDNKFVSGEKNPVSGSGDGAEENDVEQVENGDRGEEDVGDEEDRDGTNDPQEDDDQLETKEPAEDAITNEQSDYSDEEGVRLEQDADGEMIDADGAQEPQLDLPEDGVAAVLDDDLQQAEIKDRESDHENRFRVADAQIHRGAESDSDVEFVAEGPAQTQDEDDDVIMGNGNAPQAQTEVEKIRSPTPAPSNPSADHEPLAPTARPSQADQDSHFEALLAAMEADGRRAVHHQADLAEVDHAHGVMDVGDPLLAASQQAGGAGAERQALQRQDGRRGELREPYIYNGSEWVIGGPAFRG